MRSTIYFRYVLLSELIFADPPIFRLMDASRHKSVDTLSGYIRNIELFKDHAGEKLLQFARDNLVYRNRNEIELVMRIGRRTLVLIDARRFFARQSGGAVIVINLSESRSANNSLRVKRMDMAAGNPFPRDTSISA